MTANGGVGCVEDNVLDGKCTMNKHTCVQSNVEVCDVVLLVMETCTVLLKPDSNSTWGLVGTHVLD